MQLRATDRLISGMAALAIEALLGALLLGSAVKTSVHIDDVPKLVDVAPLAEMPKMHAPPPRTATLHRAARTSRPSPKAQSTQTIGLRQLTPISAPAPIVLAPFVLEGSGMASLPGPGMSLGGQGNGFGSSGRGEGDGGGGIAPHRIKGRIRDADYPRALWGAGLGGTVSVRYHVEVDGRVTGCAITGTSGNAELDALTCRLIEQRFRYRPALDEQGRPVRSIIVENHSWMVDDTELLPR